MSGFLHKKFALFKHNNLDIGIFFLSLAVIHGVAFHVMSITEIAELRDCVSYLGLAEFDFDQYEVRKYRVIVPFLASFLDFLFGDLFQVLAPWSFSGDFSISMSFLIVNNVILALTGVLVFKYVFAHTQRFLPALLGLISLLTCRWTGFVAGLPLVDSLYLFVLVMVLLGLKTRDKKLIIASIFLGPWAKEAFIFIAPIIFFYSELPKKRQILFFLLSGILVFSARFLIDYYSNASQMASLKEDFMHFGEIPVSLQRFFSLHGLYEVFSVTGFWVLLVIPALVKKSFTLYLKRFKAYEWWFIAAVMLQVFLSTDLARMMYLLTPVLAVLWGIIISDLNLLKNRGLA
ncbi:MAG: hypothetical protein ACOCTO_00215 [Marinilabiliaceae bacterium]